MEEPDKRSLKRFGLKVPALIMPFDPTQPLNKVCLISRDLSGFGGFFFSQDQWPLDSTLNILMILDFRPGSVSEAERYSLIQVEGTILRNEEGGIAVRFDEKCTISAIYSD